MWNNNIKEEITKRKKIYIYKNKIRVWVNWEL